MFIFNAHYLKFRAPVRPFILRVLHVSSARHVALQGGEQGRLPSGPAHPGTGMVAGEVVLSRPDRGATGKVRGRQGKSGEVSGWPGN